MDPTKARPGSIHWIDLMVQNRTRCRVCFDQGRRDAASLVRTPSMSLSVAQHRSRVLRDALKRHIRAEHPNWDAAINWRIER